MGALHAAVEAIGWLMAGATALPAFVLLIEIVAAWLTRGRHRALPSPPSPRMAILVPAHNEGPFIAATVKVLLEELSPGDRLLVIADNCDDDTAARAREAGATVLERRDPTRRGKGFALAYGLQHLDEDAPAVVLVVDADCRVTQGRLSDLAGCALVSGRPVQAEYLLAAPPSPSPVALVSAVALLLKNRVRPLGLAALGLPCHLTGSGMAFPWSVFRQAPETGSNLVEDMVMGLDMALANRPPLFCPQVRIGSELPSGDQAGMGQRKRWEHGVLDTVRSYVPRLLGAAFTKKSAALAALALDLMVPPLALLVSLQLSVLVSTALVFSATGAPGPFFLALASLLAVAGAVLVGWAAFAGPELPLRYALFVPLYLIWKLPLYVTLLVRGKQKTWERTARRQRS